MALQMYFGCCGSGKSHKLYEHIIAESLKHPELYYYILVPEQYNLSTQQKLISMHPQKGLLNIDVLSFSRLAHRVFEEVGYSHARGATIDDIGKNLILRHMAGRNEDKLTALKGFFDKPGYISEVKSVISEFMQYGIGDNELAGLIEKSGERGILKQKLTDIRLLYNEFLKFINEKYITTEEILEKVRDEVPRSSKLKNTVIVLDGYTGFTPVQRGLIEALLINCVDVYITLLMDTYYETDSVSTGGDDEQDLFYLSKKTIASLEKICKDNGVARKEDVIIRDDVPARFMYDEDGDLIPRYLRRHELIHLERNLFRTEAGICAGNAEDENREGSIRLFTGTDPYEEATEAAVRIERLIRDMGYHYKDIAVVTGDLDTYMKACGRAFSLYDIPFFVDKKIPVMLNPMIEYIRALFDIITEDYSYEAMFRYLKSSLCGYDSDDTDYLENYILKYGIKGRKSWSEKFVRRPRGMDESGLERINTIREAVAYDLLDFHNALVSGTEDSRFYDVRVVSTALYRFLSVHKIQEKTEAMRTSFEEEGDRVRVMEYGRIFEEVCDLLNKMVFLLPDEKMTLKEYASLLDAGFAEIRTGVLPGSDDYVQIGDITRTRLRDVKALFFMGVNDGIIPLRGGKGGIISDMEREFLSGETELAPTERMKAYEQRLYLYMLTSKPKEYLYLSFAKLNSDGDSQNPSYFINTLLKMFPHLRTELPDESRENRVYGFKSAHRMLAENAQDELKGKTDDKGYRDYLELLEVCIGNEESSRTVEGFMKGALLKRQESGAGKISRAVAAALYGRELTCSVTRLETYAKCAYSHFMQYGLSLKERELFSFEAGDMGSVFHDALKEYAGILKEKDLLWTSVDENAADGIITEAIERTIATGEYSAVYGSFRTGYAMNRMKRIMKRTVNVLTDHLKKGQFTPGEYEIDFAIGDDIRLIGRVDRMDLCTENGNTYVKIIDYKSGNRKFDMISVYAGLDLQLVVYLNAGMELISQRYEGNRVIPAGIFYYHIDDPLIKFDEAGLTDEDDDRINEKILDEFTMSGLVNSDEAVYRLMDKDFMSKSRIIPLGLKKDGGFTSSSSVASEEEFKIMTSYVKQKIKDTGDEILNGNIKAEPKRSARGRGLPCDYCSYGDVCGYRGEGLTVGIDDIRKALKEAGIDDIDACNETQEVVELMRKKIKDEG